VKGRTLLCTVLADVTHREEGNAISYESRIYIYEDYNQTTNHSTK